MIERPLVVEETIMCHTMTVRLILPDLLCYVDDLELPNFFETIEACRTATKRFIEEQQLTKKPKKRKRR